MTHEPRQTGLLRELLHTRRTAALATVDEHGAPAVSMVPFAIDPSQHCLVLHLSALAAHTAQLQRQPRAALLVAQGEVAGEAVHALPRVSIQVLAFTPAADAPDALSARAAYLARFPEAEPMTALGDFRFVLLEPVAARQVAGFGAARSVDADELRLVLGPNP